MTRWRAIPVLVLFIACHLFASPAEAGGSGQGLAAATPTRSRGGMFGRQAIGLRLEADPRNRTYVSTPANGRSRLRARRTAAGAGSEEEPVLIDLSGTIGRHRMRLVPGVGTELLWAPEGNALMLSTSNGGGNGIYDLILVDRFRGATRERNISALIRRRFGHPVRCDYPEPPNVAGIAWLPNGNLLVAAEIVHHSVCDSYGTFAAYEVRPADTRIVRAYDQIEAKRRFRPLLGWEIADAPDRCVTQSLQCRVAYGYSGHRLADISGNKTARSSIRWLARPPLRHAGRLW
jgi:hypothetical protein